MIAVVILGIICMSLMALFKDKEKGLTGAFLVATIFLCIRYEWGNDYASYLSSFFDYNSFSFGLFNIESSGSLRGHNEYGWVILNRLFGKLGVGFFGFVMVISIFENWILYHMVKKYVNPKYYWVAVFFWVFSTSFCVNASMIRQYFCICLYMIVADLMIQKKVKGYLLWAIGIILLGSTVHRSFIVMIISLPLFYIHIIRNRISIIWISAIVIVFVIWSFVGRSITAPLMLNILEDNEELSDYMNYVELGGDISVNTGLGMLFRYILLVVWILLLPKIEKEKQSFVILIIASYFFDVIRGITPMASRLTLYLTALSMICWTFMLDVLKKWPWLYGVLILEVIMLATSFIRFFYSPVWIDNFLYYHTIFEAVSWM